MYILMIVLFISTLVFLFWVIKLKIENSDLRTELYSMKIQEHYMFTDNSKKVNKNMQNTNLG
jgi:hypothetical protein